MLLAFTSTFDIHDLLYSLNKPAGRRRSQAINPRRGGVSVPAASFLCRSRRTRLHRAWCKAPRYRRPRICIFFRAGSFRTSLDVSQTRRLFFQLHRLPAALNRSVAATGHNDLRSAFGAFVAFAHLVRHCICLSLNFGVRQLGAALSLNLFYCCVTRRQRAATLQIGLIIQFPSNRVIPAAWVPSQIEDPRH